MSAAGVTRLAIAGCTEADRHHHRTLAARRE
jgi:hypothetical protein